jgi:hypothetical protein
MTLLAPDVAIAVELVDRAELSRWPRLTEELTHAPPRIHEHAEDRTEMLSGWLAPYKDLQPSFVQAAVANFARALADLRLLLQHEMDLDNHIFRLRKWYREEPRSPSLLEEFEIHVWLIGTLTIELTRAINLVITRTQQADPTVFARQALAVCATGPEHARLEAVRYSEREAEEPQPYPGLAGFPAQLARSRAAGLGSRAQDAPRTPDEFERWIARLVERYGPCSDPPPTGTPPFALDKSAPSVDADHKIPATPTIVAGVIGLFAGVAGIIASYPWLVGAAIGAVVSVAVLRRQLWRRPPHRGALAAVAIVTVVGGVIGEVAAHAGDGTKATPAIDAPRSRRALSGSASYQGVAQLEQGDFFRGGVGSVRAFTDPVLVSVGQELRLAVRLKNGGPDEIPEAIVKVTVPNIAASSESASATVRADVAHPREVADTVTMNFDANRSACLRYVSGSTQFLDSHHGVIRSLPDGVISKGLTVGPVGVPLTDTRYVVFSLRTLGLPSGSRCP